MLQQTPHDCTSKLTQPHPPRLHIEYDSCIRIIMVVFRPLVLVVIAVVFVVVVVLVVVVVVVVVVGFVAAI